MRASLVTRTRYAVMVLNPSAFSGRVNSPADFQAWTDRGRGRAVGGIPDEWSTRVKVPFESPSRVVVLLHVYYPELLDEIIGQLSAIPVSFDLIVTNASEVDVTVDPGRLPRMVNVAVLDVANHGRDILPLIRVVNAGLLDPYQIVLKIHTKKSEWRDRHQLHGTGAEWRGKLLSSLLGSEDNVRDILGAFAGSPSLGLVTADGSLLGARYWGDNEPVAGALLRRLELDLPTDLQFPAGSIYWTRGFVLQGLRALGMSAADFEPESGQVNGTTAHAIERLIGILTVEAGCTLAERSQVSLVGSGSDLERFELGIEARPRVRAIPFYLPQFHPIPENDRWWGTGFTEWSNVASARPVFRGHDQPKLPGELGFYDLRMPQTVAQQAALAEMGGLAGFMYYHYWFGGQQLLERPIHERVEGDLELPFCLMWANENWTRRWDGRESEVLMGQRYQDVPSERFLDDVLPILRDRRYLRINGRAVLAIYRPGQIPDLSAVIESWRRSARDAGVGDLFVLSVDVAKEFHGVDDGAGSAGLDGRLGFPPHNALWKWLPFQAVGAPRGFSGRVLSYRAMANDAIGRLNQGIPGDYFPGVMVGFDNTARRQSSPDIWYGANPYTFRRWLAGAADAVADRDPDCRMVFINAWNEWAEGAVLEPTSRFGRTYLLAVRDVVLG